MATTPLPSIDAIAEPMRRQILDLLRDGERTVTELVEELPIAQAGVSRHLRVLREADLVTVRPDGQRRWYGVQPDGLRELDEWLAPYRALWSRSLDGLSTHLDTMED